VTLPLFVDVNGWIILPPRRFVQELAWTALEFGASKEPSGCLYQTGGSMNSSPLIPPTLLPISLNKQRRDQGTATVPAKADVPIEKIRVLPEERLSEVEDFIDFIRLREQQRALARDAAVASATAFAAVWSNLEDDVYDGI
jgi:hypothetical protein